jgi:hypothetical protein
MTVRTRTCSGCSHDRELHEHCRPGSDCALCDCTSYRSWSLAGLVGLVRMTPAPAVVPAVPVVRALPVPQPVG